MTPRGPFQPRPFCDNSFVLAAPLAYRVPLKPCLNSPESVCVLWVAWLWVNKISVVLWACFSLLACLQLPKTKDKYDFCGWVLHGVKSPRSSLPGPAHACGFPARYQRDRPLARRGARLSRPLPAGQARWRRRAGRVLPGRSQPPGPSPAALALCNLNVPWLVCFLLRWRQGRLVPQRLRNRHRHLI